MKVIEYEVLAAIYEEWASCASDIAQSYDESGESYDLGSDDHLTQLEIVKEIFAYKDSTISAEDATVAFDTEELKMIDKFFQGCGHYIIQSIEDHEDFWGYDFDTIGQAHYYLNFGQYCIDTHQAIFWPAKEETVTKNEY